MLKDAEGQKSKCPKCGFTVRANGCWCTDKPAKIQVIPDLPEYWDHGLGQVIKSRSERRQVMKDKNLVEVGNEMEYMKRQERAKERDWDRQMEKTNLKAIRMLSDPQWN